jgi:division protein CdvB (Snf7/Vps24/ESCRT-III family)
VGYASITQPFEAEAAMSKFAKEWKAQEKDSFGKRTREAVKGPKPIRPQILRATQQLTGEVNRLDAALNRLKQRENSIFKKTVSAVQSHDQESSKAYSNELAEVRKMTKIVTQSKLALEQTVAQHRHRIECALLQHLRQQQRCRRIERALPQHNGELQHGCRPHRVECDDHR